MIQEGGILMNTIWTPINEHDTEPQTELYWTPTPAFDDYIKELTFGALLGTRQEYVVAHNKRVMNEKKYGGIYRGLRAKTVTFDEW